MRLGSISIASRLAPGIPRVTPEGTAPRDRGFLLNVAFASSALAAAALAATLAAALASAALAATLAAALAAAALAAAATSAAITAAFRLDAVERRQRLLARRRQLG